MRPRLVSSTAALVLAAAACGTTTQFAPTNPSPRPLSPRLAESVLVFASGLPAQPFVEIGIIQARQSSELSMHEMPEIIAEMRQAAGAQGCDGLLLNGARDKTISSGGGTDASVFASTTTLEGFWGTCIVFTEPGGPAVSQHVAP